MLILPRLRVDSSLLASSLEELQLPPRSLADLREVIARRRLKVTKATQPLAAYVLQNPLEVSLDGARQIALKAGVKMSTVTRFAHSLGFVDYRDFQKLFQAEMKRRSALLESPLSAIDDAQQ